MIFLISFDVYNQKITNYYIELQEKLQEEIQKLIYENNRYQKYADIADLNILKEMITHFENQIEANKNADYAKRTLEIVDYLNIEIEEKNLFNYAVAVATLSCVIQLAFIYTILREYFGNQHLVTNDVELITIRILAMVTFGLYLWIELANGRKIFLF